MQRRRPFTTQRVYGMGFIAVVLAIIVCIHATYVFLIWGPHIASPDAIVVLFFYHIIFVNLMASFYQCIMIDPGVVPPYWGFYMGDETKRRRYCKMCNVWKPDRTHHCSVCNRCILNMDHHCPWINNCVGFYNRKFFIQLLVYAYSILVYILISSILAVFHHIMMLLHTPNILIQSWYICASVIIFMAWSMSFFMACVLTNFIKFHLKLVFENYTTIENLEREENAKSKFDIGCRRNWEQVFGATVWLWWFPCHTLASRPIGDGVRWRVHYTRVIDEDEELPAEDANAGRLLQPGGGQPRR